MTIDLSKIPSTCRYILSNCNGIAGGNYGCQLYEQIGGRQIQASAFATDQQEAIDMAISKFLGEQR